MHHQLSDRLKDLVDTLHNLGERLELHVLADLLRRSELLTSDVEDFVRENPRGYNRALVSKSPYFEMLILTWLPGQGSPPHDHAGSVSSMLVIEGQAAEGSWRIADDGYAELDFETQLGPGEITAWQDAGIHTVRNPNNDGKRLVTLHIYAPPVGEFRRYVSRPAGLRKQYSLPDSRPVVAVVGGGFSGSITASQLLRLAEAKDYPLRVILVERRGTIGEGIAYGTKNPAHLLNVPAGRMGAWPDCPEDFLQWARHRNNEVQTYDFLPRQWYGEYIRESLLATAANVKSSRLEIRYDEVRRLSRRPNGGWMVHFEHGRSTPTDGVVLAIGHRPPSDPLHSFWTGTRERVISDPWQNLALHVIEPDEPVIVLGSGLTAVDTVLSLTREARTAPVILVSRRGLLPHSHAASPLPPNDAQSLVEELQFISPGKRMIHAFRWIRRNVRKSIASGGDWRSVVDGIRPYSIPLWQLFHQEDREFFLKRLRPFWEVHRHRMAVDVGMRFEQLLRDGVVRLESGTIVRAHGDREQVSIDIRSRRDQRLLQLNAAWIINCTGPEAPNFVEASPVIGSLLVSGFVRPDSLNLGLECHPTGQAIDQFGHPLPDLFMVGTLRKSLAWESTAVPELRVQATQVATELLDWLQQARLSGIGAGI